jgi:hypothetical protein
MKVNIGPYKGWTGPYQIADKIFFWLDQHGIYDDDDPRLKRWDYKAHDKLGNWLASTWVSDFCNWFDNKKKRKVKIHIDPYDTWSMDHTLALIIHPLLVQLKEKNHGYFSVDEEDTPIEAGVKDEYGSDSKAEERYNWVMDELIWTFDQLINTERDIDLFYSEENGWDLEASNKYNDRIRNGLRLFGKYYRGLWD